MLVLVGIIVALFVLLVVGTWLSNRFGKKDPESDTTNDGVNVAQPEVPSLVDFEEVKSQLETERNTIIKINKVSDSEEYVRSLEDASLILDCVKGIQQSLFFHQPTCE